MSSRTDRLQDPEYIESMLRRTGGIEVDILGRITWGHKRSTRGGEAVPPGFEERPGGSETVLVIASGLIPEEREVRVGTPVDVEGEPLQVLDHQLLQDGELLALMVGSWQHEVEVYARTRSGTRTRGHQEGAPEKLGQTVCDLKALGGQISEEDAGDFAASTWEGRLPPDADWVKTGHVLVVVDGTIPVDYLEVEFVGDKTPRWRIPFRARETEETIDVEDFD